MDKLTQLSRSNNLCEQETESSDHYLDLLESEEDWAIAPIRVGQEHDRLIDDVFQGTLTNSFAVYAKTARLFDWTEFVLLLCSLTLLGLATGCQSTPSSPFTFHSQKTEYQFRAQNAASSQKRKGILTPVVDFFRKDENEWIANPPSFSQPADFGNPPTPPNHPVSPNHPSLPAPPDFTPSQIFGNRAEPYPLASQPFQSPQPNQWVVQPTVSKADNERQAATLSANLHPDWVDRSFVSTGKQLSLENKRHALSVEQANTLNQSEQIREPAPVPTLTPLTPKKDNTRLAKLREVVRNEKDLPLSTVSALPVSHKTERLAELPKDTMFVPQGHFAPLLDDLESTGTSKSQTDSGSQKKEGQDNQQRIGGLENPTRQVAYQSNAFVQPPNEMQSAEDWERSLRQTIDSLKTRINLSTNRDSVLQDELRLRLLTLALGEQRESQQPISGLDEHFQGFYSNELFGLATLLDERTTPDVSTRCIMAQPHFQEAQEQLQHFCPLRMRNLQFIKNDWRGFGGYTPMKGEFQPDDYPLIYLELENVAVGGNEAIGYNTKMSFSYEILDGNGATVSKSDNMLCEEVSRSRRKDISWTIPIELPNTLSPGHYFVLIRAVDQNHLRLQMDTQRIGFMITPIRTPTSSQ